MDTDATDATWHPTACILCECNCGLEVQLGGDGGQHLVKLRGAPIRPIAAMHIRPSADIGVLASEFVKSGKLLVSSPVTRRLIEGMAAGESGRENDFLSYLMFDGNWASELIELGHRDAAAKEEELAKFFMA